MRTTHWLIGQLICTVCLCGCGGDAPPPASETTGSPSETTPAIEPQEPAEPTEPVSHSLRPNDPQAIPIPTGDAVAIVAFLNDMAGRSPTGDSPEEENESLSRFMDARIRGSEKLINDPRSRLPTKSLHPKPNLSHCEFSI